MGSWGSRYRGLAGEVHTECKHGSGQGTLTTAIGARHRLTCQDRGWRCRAARTPQGALERLERACQPPGSAWSGRGRRIYRMAVEDNNVRLVGAFAGVGSGKNFDLD